MLLCRWWELVAQIAPFLGTGPATFWRRSHPFLAQVWFCPRDLRRKSGFHALQWCRSPPFFHTSAMPPSHQRHGSEAHGLSFSTDKRAELSFCTNLVCTMKPASGPVFLAKPHRKVPFEPNVGDVCTRKMRLERIQVHKRDLYEREGSAFPLNSHLPFPL